LVFAFQGQSGLEWNLPAGLYRTLDSSYRFGGFVGRTELASVLHNVFLEAFALVNVVDDAELERLFKRISVAGDYQLDGLALADEARQTLSAAGAWQNAEIHFGESYFAGVFA